MKKNIFIGSLLAITCAAFGVIFNEFQSWDYLVENSPDIIIARCLITPDFTQPSASSKPILHMDDVIESDIQVVFVLKGKTKTGFSKMTSWYRPCQGDKFLLFADYRTSGTNAWYVATENYRAIPLNRNFHISDLNGKTLDDKIQLIMSSRLKDLNEEIARDKEEKARLESDFKK